MTSSEMVCACTHKTRNSSTVKNKKISMLQETRTKGRQKKARNEAGTKDMLDCQAKENMGLNKV